MKDNNKNYLFFWNEPKRDIVDISCLNQWYKIDFVVDNILYKTAEHYMMYQKAILFEDFESANKILNSNSPKEVQMIGREVKNFSEELWQKLSFDIVVKANIHKFAQNKELKNYLLSTNNKILVEASPIDKIWGIGLKKDDIRATNQKEWLGENKLGFALMKVREELK